MTSVKTRAELETVIRQSAEDKTWTVFTEVPRTIRRMERLFGKGTKKSAVGYEWRNVPLSSVRLCQPAKTGGTGFPPRNPAARPGSQTQDEE